MQTIRVIASKHYRHKPTGRTASIYGSAPWRSDAEAKEWAIEVSGFTWEHVDFSGRTTVGLGRVPAKTYEDAVSQAKRFCEATGAQLI